MRSICLMPESEKFCISDGFGTGEFTLRVSCMDCTASTAEVGAMFEVCINCEELAGEVCLFFSFSCLNCMAYPSWVSSQERSPMLMQSLNV